MAVFDKYWAEKAEYDKQHPKQMVRVVTHENPNFNISILKQNIDNVDSMSDVELRRFIDRSFRNIINIIFKGDNSAKYINNFQNVRFLEAFIDVVLQRQYLEKDEIIICNKLSYHYITMPKEKQEQKIVSRMHRLSRTVNRYSLPRLLGLGLSEDLASLLLMARYSDLDLNVCVRRIDFIIITQPKELMSQLMITEIYKCLFNIWEDFIRIFPYIMLDVLPEYKDDVPETWWITDEVEEVDSTLGLAILDILNSLPTQTIRNVILNYSEGQNIVSSDKPVRFSLLRLSNDFERINAVVDELVMIEHIMVP